MPASKVGNSNETAGDKSEEGGDDVKSSCSLCPGPHTYYNGKYRGKQNREVEPNPKTRLSSDCSLKFDCMKMELLVIAGQHTAVNTFSGLVHTARQTMGVGNARSRWHNPIGSEPSKAGPMTGVKS